MVILAAINKETPLIRHSGMGTRNTKESYSNLPKLIRLEALGNQAQSCGKDAAVNNIEPREGGKAEHWSER